MKKKKGVTNPVGKMVKGNSTTKKGQPKQPPGTGAAGSFGYPHKT